VTGAPEPEIYVPHAQEPWRFAHLVIRTDAAHAATLPAAIRAQMAQVDKRMPFDRFVWMDDLVAAALAPVRFQMVLLGFFAGVALLLSLVCIYGVMSYVVSLRLNELGVRMALGASPRDLVWLVVREAMTPALGGIVVGLAVAIALARVLRAQFSAVDSTDPATLAAVVIALVAVALVACYLPARRATKVDPIITLRAG
jgi:putative ABC transport system permease protein